MVPVLSQTSGPMVQAESWSEAVIPNDTKTDSEQFHPATAQPPEQNHAPNWISPPPGFYPMNNPSTVEGNQLTQVYYVPPPLEFDGITGDPPTGLLYPLVENQDGSMVPAMVGEFDVSLCPPCPPLLTSTPIRGQSNINDLPPLSDIDLSLSQVTSCDPVILTPEAYGGGQEPPYVAISKCGLISIMCRDNIMVEMTLDRALRMTNGKYKSATAVNNKGNMAAIHSPHTWMLQEETRTEISTACMKRVKVSPDSMVFASGERCFEIYNDKLYVTRPEFSDLSHDRTVSLLSSSSSYGPQLIPICQQVVSSARFTPSSPDLFTVKINGVTIKQNNLNTVSVICDNKFLRASPRKGEVMVSTPHVQMEIKARGYTKLHQRQQFVQMTSSSMLVSNRRVEGGFIYSQNKVFFKPTPFKYTVQGYSTTYTSQSGPLGKYRPIRKAPQRLDIACHKEPDEVPLSNSAPKWSSLAPHSSGSVLMKQIQGKGASPKHVISQCQSSLSQPLPSFTSAFCHTFSDLKKGYVGSSPN